MNEDYNYFLTKEFRRSLAAYEQMVKSGREVELDSETLTDIAEFYAMNMQEEEANRCIQYALSFYPDSVDPQIFLARQQMFHGNKERAWQICNAIADQDDREVTFLKAELSLHFQESEQAFNILMSNYDPNAGEEAAEYLYDSIVLIKDYGFGDKALDWVLYLREKHPDYLPALALQAEVHNYRREYTLAIELLEHYIGEAPYDAHAWLQLAEAYLWIERHDEALEAVDYALAINPEDAEALLLRGNILCDAMRMEEAHTYYRRFLNYFPQDERVIYMDAQCLISMEQFEQAIAQLEYLLKQPGSNPMHGDYYSYLAYCHQELGHEEQARHYRQQAEKEPTNSLQQLFPNLYPESPTSPDAQDDITSGEENPMDLPF